MPDVKCFTIAGLKLWFWSDDHHPPHFHAKKTGAWEYRVIFQRAKADMFEVKWLKTKKSTMSRQERNEIADLVATHRADLLQEWESIHE